MANKKYDIVYFQTFILQFKNILYYITYELKNKIAADNLYKSVVKQIETRANAPESYEVYKVIKGKKYYKINVKKFIIFYVVKNDVMEIRSIYYNKRNVNNLM